MRSGSRQRLGLRSCERGKPCRARAQIARRNDPHPDRIRCSTTGFDAELAFDPRRLALEACQPVQRDQILEPQIAQTFEFLREEIKLVTFGINLPLIIGRIVDRQAEYGMGIRERRTLHGSRGICASAGVR